MRLQRYDFQLTYEPGKEVPVADALSRAAPISSAQNIENATVVDCNCMTSYLAISDPTLAELKKETARDAVLQELIAIVQKGWPEKRSSAPIAVRPYYHLRSELTVEQGLVFKGHRCIVPSEMRPEILRKIHLPHMGLESALRFGRQVVFWPDMNSQLKDLLQKCEVCCSLHAKQPREPLQPHPIAERPWEVIGVDLFSLEDSAFLVTVDYYSGFWEIDQLQGLGATSVIRCLKRHFARY